MKQLIGFLVLVLIINKVVAQNEEKLYIFKSDHSQQPNRLILRSIL
jgi:hypothetical protein